jgi:hypothetical protein
VLGFKPGLDDASSRQNGCQFCTISGNRDGFGGLWRTSPFFGMRAEDAQLNALLP